MKSFIFLLCLWPYFAKAEVPYIDFPQGRVSIDNVCTTGESLRTINPILVCEEISVVARFACRQADQEYCRPLKSGQQPNRFEQLKEETACTKKGVQIFETPREYQVNECSHWEKPRNPEQGQPECTSWRTLNKKYPLTYQVSGQMYALPLCQ